MKSNQIAARTSNTQTGLESAQREAGANLRILTTEELETVAGGITVNMTDFAVVKPTSSITVNMTDF